MSKNKPVYVNGRVVGRIEGNTFYKTIRKGLYLESPPGIAFEETSIDDAIKMGASKVEVKDTDTGVIYRAPIAIVLEKGMPLDRQWGKQIALLMRYWDYEGKPEIVPLKLKPEPKPVTQKQTEMFA